MNEALLSNSTDIVSGGVPGLITLWDKTQGTSFEVKGICALSSQPFLLNTANPDIKSIKDFTERDRIAVPSIKVSVQAVLLQMAAAAAYGVDPKGSVDLMRSLSEPAASTDKGIADLAYRYALAGKEGPGSVAVQLRTGPAAEAGRACEARAAEAGRGRQDAGVR